MRLSRYSTGRSAVPAKFFCSLALLFLSTPSGWSGADSKETKQPEPDGSDPRLITTSDVAKKGGVRKEEELSFDQSKVVAEMTELEDRMFRLAETLRSLEPEDSSRLMMALKFARAELILHRMKEAQQLLGKLKLEDAAKEETALLTKLEKLRQLLLSTDLDLQMQLGRLRLLRRILGRLDKAIGEEDREQNLSGEMARLQETIKQLLKRLEKIREQIEQASGEKKTLLRKEQKQLEEELKRLRKRIAQKEFDSLQRAQRGNRRFTDGIGQSMQELGQIGTEAIRLLRRASTSMSSAEGALVDARASLANLNQNEALQSLQEARMNLAEEADRLLDLLRRQVGRRIVEGLSIMLEKQVVVRESTEALRPRIEKGSREALTAVVRLARSEGRIIDLANELLAMIEETEFGIALPAALGMVRDSMSDVKQSLENGDVSEGVVNLERRIEEDLKTMLDAVKEMPPPPSSPRKGERSRDERVRELNRLIAELKMIRLMQVRVNHQTQSTDSTRQKKLADLGPAILRRIESVRDKQEDVFETTDRLSEERVRKPEQ